MRKNDTLRVAVLVDGGFFHKRYQHTFANARLHTPQEVSDNLYKMVEQYVGPENYLYRVFYYDCIPLNKKFHHPVSGRVTDFARLPITTFRLAFFSLLKRRRKTALRLGSLRENKAWFIRSANTSALLSGEKMVHELREEDVFLEVRQKGIDMKIGIDIATLAYKQLVDRIVLIAGDADFIPAAKLARTEGVDFLLDPMWNNIDEQLYEHVDGLLSASPRPAYLHQTLIDPAA